MKQSSFIELSKIKLGEAKITAHIGYLRDLHKLAYWSINVYRSGIFHFFEMNASV
jgi:hypothetical protein